MDFWPDAVGKHELKASLSKYHDAIQRKDRQTALNLLAYWAGPYIVNCDGNNAFHVAARYYPSYFEELINHNEKWTNIISKLCQNVRRMGSVDFSNDYEWHKLAFTYTCCFGKMNNLCNLLWKNLLIQKYKNPERYFVPFENLGLYQKNKEGKLPVVLAIENGIMESLKNFIKKLDHNKFQRMMDLGFRPLHEPIKNEYKIEVIDIIADHDKTFLEIKDENQETPLFANIRNADFSIVWHLIFAHGVNMNEKDAEGHNVLEATVSCWMTDINWHNKKIEDNDDTKTLIAFVKLFQSFAYETNKEFMHENFIKRKKSHFADEFDRMWSSFTNITNNLQKFCLSASTSNEKHNNFVAEVLKPTSARGLRVLSLDGGGIRGITTVMILMELEKRLRQKLDEPGLLIAQCFDYIGGTSTGAIIALALASGKPAMEILQLYLRFKDNVFEGQRPYDSSILENFLKKEFGEETTLANISKFENLKVMITATKTGKIPLELVLLKNYDEDGLPSTKQTTAWFAARCSSAAPTYFESPDKVHIDGGLMANNPCLNILSEIKEESAPLTCVVSIGTGRAPEKSVPFKDVPYE